MAFRLLEKQLSQFYLGKSGSDYYILIGDTTSSWSYGQVHVTKVTTATYYNVINWAGDWSISKVTTDPTTIKSANLNASSSTTLNTNGYLNAGGVKVGTTTVIDDSRNVSAVVGTFSGNLRRTAHNVGHLEGGHNNVGGTSSATSPIYTIGSSYNPAVSTLGNMYGIGFSHTNASFIGFAGTSGWGMYVASDGDARVYLSGETGGVYATGNITAYASDARLKTNIKPIENALEKLNKIRGVEYDWVDNITSEYDFHPASMHETGVIAQEIQEVIPDAVTEAPMNGNYTAKCGTDHKFLTVQKDKIVPLLIEAVKEQQKEIDELKSLVKQLLEK